MSEAPEAGCDLSVVLPAYNEGRLIESRVERLVRHLRRRGGGWEILVVDDGSTDSTASRVEKAGREEPRVRLLRVVKNEGKGAALARGLLESRGAIIAVTDADLSYSLADLDAAVAAIRSGAEFAAGTRRHAGSRINLPFVLFPYLVRRWVAGTLFRALVRLLFGGEFSDTQCGLKAFSRSAARAIVARLRTRRFLADIEIHLAARGLGLKRAGIPVHLRYLSGDSSSVRMLGGLPATLYDLARIKAAEMRGGYER